MHKDNKIIFVSGDLDQIHIFNAKYFILIYE